MVSMVEGINFAGEFKLNRAFLESPTGEKIDLIKNLSIVEINIFEDIFKSCMSGSIIVGDSRDLVNNLGHFSKVDFYEIDNTEKDDSWNINIYVEEQSTGEFSLGGGYSSANGAQATFGLS